MVEYDHNNPEYYDGISEIMCLECGTRFGRWTGKEFFDSNYDACLRKILKFQSVSTYKTVR
jgi:hypothetical protein